MSLHRFIVAPADIDGEGATIQGPEGHHLSAVLRLRPGEEVAVLDGSGAVYPGQLVQVGDGWARVRFTGGRMPASEPPVPVTLVQALVKGERMDLVLQKAVELGVSCVVPVVSERTVVRLEGERRQERVARWQRIAAAACKQCGRGLIPRIEALQDLGAVLERGRLRPAVMLYEAERSMGLKQVLRAWRERCRQEGLLLFVGPEGGFSPAEVEQARSCGVVGTGLGPRILRAETAGIVGLALVLYELGDLGGGDER
ncbi:MAG: 16S rRNA (uracil(1498)-N(3))-methyltransferase [Syntrophomonadaceae bacterium]|nr:16S rRNA (uracil(1498)-N(3))-methyltransferase [Syntrophomonadaceae bacterium]